MSNGNNTNAVVWTPEQELAMTLRGGNILVTASAGSGKTAVLTERLMRRLTDAEAPADIRRFVVVTFMKAAAVEMKDRLAVKLNAYLREHPKDKRVKCQLMYLHEANISTIDSFCRSLIERYSSAGVADYSPVTTIASDAEQRLLFGKALSEAIEAEYENGDADFYALADAVDNGGSNDKVLKDAVWKLHYVFRTIPDPDAFCESVLASYGADYCDVKANPLYRRVLVEVEQGAEYYASASKALIEVAPESTFANLPKYVAMLGEIAGVCEKLQTAAAAGDASECARLLSEFELARLPAKDSSAPEWYVKCGELKNAALKSFIDKYAAEFTYTEDSLRGEASLLMPITRKLFALAKSAEKRYAALKTEKGVWDYADLELRALDLLWERGENGELRRTAISLEESKLYDEILIDEYQDVNEVQELIFRGICSENEDNIFMVGDVKQSIYGFRGATPKLFIKHREEYNRAAPENAEFPAKIALNCNFRSRREVTDAVNSVFNAIMKKSTCGMDYLEDDRLVPTAGQAEDESAGAYFTMVEGTAADEANYVAAKINELMASGMTVRDKSGERPLEYRDIAILLRTVKNKSNIYLDALTAAGIPACAPSESGCLSSPSVRRMISVLRAIDNPMKDIDLVAAMSSAVFGFTDSELVRIRKVDGGAFYYAVKAAADAGNEKCVEFMSQLAHLRRKAAVLTADKLIWYIYKSTGFLAFASTLKNGEHERRALMCLYESAASYGSFGRQDLSGFVAYTDRVISEGVDLGDAFEVSAGNEVGIMSIHKSKGLEYPVCFLCGVSSRFNTSDTAQSFVMEPDLGIGMKIVNTREHKVSTTAAREAVLRGMKVKRIREEMRMLYVAMTRAKKHLEIVASVKEPEKLAEKSMYRLDSDGRIDDYSVTTASSMLDWIAPVAFGSDAFYVSAVKAEAAEAQAMPEHGETPQADEALAEAVYRRINYEYTHTASSDVPMKLTVSDIVAAKAGKDTMEDVCSRKPACLERGKRDGAEAGTATHAFLQFADFSRLDDIDGELERLVSQRFITEKQASMISRRKLEAIASSELMARIKASKQVTREFRFTFEANASEFIPDAPDEKLLVQGAIDCVFEEDGKCVVVDYKTDRIADEAAVARKTEYYAPQLELYARALREITGKEVSECILYFLDADREVKVM